MTKRGNNVGKGVAAAGISVGGVVLLVIVIILRLIMGEDVSVIFEDVTPEPAAGSNNVSQPVVASSDGDWYEIYFTNPTCPDEPARRGGLDGIVAADIAQTQFQVDMAAFDFDSEPMLEAFISLEEANENADAPILIRIVTDEDNGSLSAINRLRRNGISVVEDKRTALMHNKFVVIDGRYVWMGSMNFTSNGVYCNNNNLVRFDSPELAANYTAEMNEMYDGREFGPRSPDATPNKELIINGVRVENYFAAEEEIDVIIADRIAGAESEILFMAFSFTNDFIGEAMIEQAEAGRSVRGVFETVGSDTIYSYYGPLADLGAGRTNVAVRTDGNGRIMHHKVIIIDQSIVIFGSYNFSANANDSNDENVLIVHDPAFAGYFVDEFETVWAEAAP